MTSSMMTTSLDNPMMSSLSSGYFSHDSSVAASLQQIKSNHVKSGGQDIQVVANDIEDGEEPSILAIKTCVPAKAVDGFSHLDWSARIPYNLAEEPDDVQGMKHSHSCQSMPCIPPGSSSSEAACKSDCKSSLSPVSSASLHCPTSSSIIDSPTSLKSASEEKSLEKEEVSQ
jgi:hypothetical protein